jgi:flagellin-like protein
MRMPRRWRRSGRRAVSPIIGTILLLAITIVAGVILWSFRIYQPPATPQVTFLIRSGGSNPVWGDPTDESGGGTYSLMNTTQVIVATHTPAAIPLDEVYLTFICDNTSHGGNRTVLLSGTLANMTWIPGVSGGSSGTAPVGAPTLGWCASLKINGYGGGAVSTAYNRLMIFDPISANETELLENGDTLILYIHKGGYPLDYEDSSGDCAGHVAGYPCLDGDDYHGAPPWCFTTEGACTIYLTYTGSPSTLLATIPVYSLAPPTSG